MTPSSALNGTDSVLVAAATQHDDGLAGHHAIEEGLDQGALADAGRTVHIDGRRGAERRFPQGRLQRVQLSVAADERRLRIRR